LRHDASPRVHEYSLVEWSQLRFARDGIWKGCVNDDGGKSFALLRKVNCPCRVPAIIRRISIRQFSLNVREPEINYMIVKDI